MTRTQSGKRRTVDVLLGGLRVMRTEQLRSGGARAVLTAVLSSLALVFGIVGIAAPAQAETLGYPWADATTLNAAKYDWGYATCPSNDPNCKAKMYVLNGVTYGQYDPWSYYLRNCTSYVAWKLASLGVPASKISGLGNGGLWYENALKKGLSGGTTPQVGAAAVSTSVGHVAYVEAVNPDGTITISEYNYQVRGDGDYRTGTPAALKFDKFVYFGALISIVPNSQRLGRNGGFEQQGAGWNLWPGTNFITYADGSARSAQRYAATNTSVAGGGIFQDVAVSAQPGDLFCATAYLRTEGNATGARGRFTLWLLGGSYNESGSAAFSGLGNGGNWSPRTACVASTTPETTLRIQFYPDAGSPTLNIDDVHVW